MVEIVITSIELSTHLIPAIVLVAIFGKYCINTLVVDIVNHPLLPVHCANNAKHNRKFTVCSVMHAVVRVCIAFVVVVVNVIFFPF